MFLHLSVCPRGGVCLSACWDTTAPPPRSRRPPPPGTRHRPSPAGTPPLLEADTPPEQTPQAGSPGPDPSPPPADDYGCGRYASYWNAFLFSLKSSSKFINIFCQCWVNDRHFDGAKWAAHLFCPSKCLSKTVTLTVRVNKASLPPSAVVVGCASFAPFPVVAPSSIFPPGVSPGSYAPVVPWSPASSSRLFATEYK